jgi:hypothetical protein
METATFSLDEETIEILNTVSNKSEFIREAIAEKVGKKDKSLQDLALEINQKRLELETLDKQYFELLDKVLGHKEELRLSEIEEMEARKIRKDREDKEFMDKYFSLFSSYNEIVNITTEQSNDLSYLMGIVEKLVKDGHRVGISQIRRYLMLKQ